MVAAISSGRRISGRYGEVGAAAIHLDQDGGGLPSVVAERHGAATGSAAPGRRTGHRSGLGRHQNRRLSASTWPAPQERTCTRTGGICEPQLLQLTLSRLVRSKV